MPSRVKQHQLEDISRSKYSLTLPREWVMRDKDKDYGIDAEVEIFDERGDATGLVYWVQLKATETSDKNAARKLDLSIDAIKYYKRLDLPILIARYLSKEDKFYCKWAHKIDLYYSKKSAKTLRITFTDNEIWDGSEAEDTIIYLRKLRAINSGAITLPAPTHININSDTINGISRGSFIASYRKLLSDYSHIIRDEPKKEKCLIDIRIDNKDLIISLSSLTECTFHGITKANDNDFVHEVIIHIILGIGSLLASIGQNELAARILLDKKIKDSFISNEKLVFKFLPNLMSSSKYGEIIDTVIEVMRTSDDNSLESITTMSALASLDINNQDMCSKFQELQYKCLEKSTIIGDESLIGISHYNLGNNHRNLRSCRKSIYHYLQARKHEPNYLNQIYYYQELGGAFFECGKYRVASKLYKKALKMGAEDSIRPLYADALMFDGKYQLALDAFTDYLETEEDIHAEWRLKALCLNNLISMTGNTEQIRHHNEAVKVIDISNPDTPEFIEKLEDSINLDNLCGAAWFNTGIVESKSGKHLEAAYSFILCGLVQTGDIEAWVNATLCCLNKEVEMQLLPLVIHASYFFNSEDYLLSLHEQLETRFNGEMLNTLTNMIEEILPEDSRHQDIPKIRLMGDDGIFRDVITGKNA